MKFPPLQMYGWFDVKLFYLRVGSPVLEEVPDTLLLVYWTSDSTTKFEVNGRRISNSESACLALRRDRVDLALAEATYVNTNNLSTTGGLRFKVYDKDELVVQGKLARIPEGPQYAIRKCGSEAFRSSPLSAEAGWSMRCSCVSSSTDCYSLLKGRTDLCAARTSMEVYVAGQTSGLPIVLSRTVLLATKQKDSRVHTMATIPEEEDFVCEQDAPKEVLDKLSGPGLSCQSEVLSLPSSMRFSEEDGLEVSLFNAGVGIGVALGLVVCFGVGVGMSLLMRSYQASAGPSRRRRLF
ncbi:hypothetical protein KP509_36G065400 [Ceratopteris richardii]|uniref:Uncharacterized protein n=1 Tax=Ceratopteris richardii TaxID=49495 RepID=A0A8T2QCP5_CERRI|nr:hypothetical protein KP509_36G065400 [Ceratopteris richardii]